MNNNQYKKIIVTPAGRKRFLSILYKYLVYYHNLNEFDEWHLWCNTDIKEDVDFIYELQSKYDFIKVIPFPNQEEISRTCNCNNIIRDGGNVVYACTIPYFIAVDSSDENTIYLRLDDDIVFIKKDSIKNIFQYRQENKDSFLVFGNIINNGAISHVHQNIGVLSKQFGEVSFDAFDYLGLRDGNFAIYSHNNFFEKYENNQLDQYKFESYILDGYNYISIQSICWLGSDYKKFNGQIPIGVHDEEYQTKIRPQIENRTNAILGDSLFCHYATESHRVYVDHTNILSKYYELAEKYLV